MKKFCAALLVLFVFSCKEKPKPQAEAKTHAVVIVFVSGSSADIINASGTVKATKGALVNQDDRIVTGAKSIIDLLLPNKIVVRVDQNTTLEMRTLSTAADGGQNDKLYLQRGIVFAKVAKLGPHSTFAVQTPTVVAGVRGTEFMTASDEKGAGKVAVTEGRVAVQAKSAETAVNAGEQANVDDAGGVESGQIDEDTLEQMKQFTTVADARAEMSQMLEDAIRYQEEALKKANASEKIQQLKEETKQKIDAQKDETKNKIQEMKQGTEQKKDEIQNSIEKQRKKRDELFNKNKLPQQ